MNLYKVYFMIEGQLNQYSKEKISLELDNFPVEIILPSEENPGLPIKATIITKAKDLQEAQTKVLIPLYTVLDILSFYYKTALQTKYCYAILKDQTGDTERLVWRQWVSGEDDRSLWITQEKYAEIKELVSKDLDPKVALSLSWLRTGYCSLTYLSRFSNYWLSLEKLVGKEVKERICDSETCSGLMKCEKCEKTQKYQTINKKELLELIKKHNPTITDKELKQIWSARQKVFHGETKQTPKFLGELRDYIELLETTIENELEEILKTNKIPLKDVVNLWEKTEMCISIYKFNTKTPQKEFAEDFLTDAEIQELEQSADLETDRGATTEIEVF